MRFVQDDEIMESHEGRSQRKKKKPRKF